MKAEDSVIPAILSKKTKAIIKISRVLARHEDGMYGDGDAVEEIATIVKTFGNIQQMAFIPIGDDFLTR